MKKSKFTEEQIVFCLRQQELGTSVDEVCRKMRVSQQTFYRWKSDTVALAQANCAAFVSWKKKISALSAWLLT